MSKKADTQTQPLTATEAPPKQSVLEGFAPYVLGIPALIYGTGILVSTTYFGRWNMTDLSGGELVRARYLQIGLFAFSLPVLWGSSFLAYFYFRRIEEQIALTRRASDKVVPDLKRMLGETLALLNRRTLRPVTWEFVIRLISERPYWPKRFYFWGLLSWLNMFLVLTVIASLGRPSWFGETPFVVCFVSLPTITVLGSYFISGFIDELGVNKNLMRFFLFVGMLALDCGIIHTCKDSELLEIISSIWNNHRSAMSLYAVLSFAVVMMLVGARKGAREAPTSAVGRTIWAVVGVSIIPLYYYAVIGFAFAIFPYIPATKGGADYTAAAQVKIICKSNDEIRPFERNGLLLLEETANWIYVAKASEADVLNWRVGYVWIDQKREVAAPRIIRLSREKVFAIKSMH
ncbi:hypothetical protein B7486_23885 [cyanobacterium TDX16]|nr:hypothetical protein B7486_23885 [cyanobacterium TDX16]